MDAALIGAVEEVLPPQTEQQRRSEGLLAHAIAHEEVEVVLRRLDGTELSLDPEDLRGLWALAAARALGHRVSIVAHELLVSPQRAAALLGVSRPMVYRYIEAGDLQATRVGSHWRIRAGDVLALARRRREQAEAIDEGFAGALATGGQQGRRVDAKGAWRQASEEERDVTRSLVADVMSSDEPGQ